MTRKRQQPLNHSPNQRPRLAPLPISHNLKSPATNEKTPSSLAWRSLLTVLYFSTRSAIESSPRLSQLDSCFIERGALSVKRLHRSPVIVLLPWGTAFSEKFELKPVPKERPDGMKLARHYQALLDSGKFESRAALARHLGVSRARVTQVLKRLSSCQNPRV